MASPSIAEGLNRLALPEDEACFVLHTATNPQEGIPLCSVAGLAVVNWDRAEMDQVEAVNDLKQKDLLDAADSAYLVTAMAAWQPVVAEKDEAAFETWDVARATAASAVVASVAGKAAVVIAFAVDPDFAV